MLSDEEKLWIRLDEVQGQIGAVAALAARYQMALEAIAACEYKSDSQLVAKMALADREGEP